MGNRVRTRRGQSCAVSNTESKHNGCREKEVSKRSSEGLRIVSGAVSVVLRVRICSCVKEGLGIMFGSCVSTYDKSHEDV
jgi:hypothetical protein